MNQSRKVNRKYLNLISCLGNLLVFFFNLEIKNSLFWIVLQSFYSKERKVNYSNAGGMKPSKNKTKHKAAGMQLEQSFDFSG